MNRQALRIECGRIHARLEQFQRGFNWSRYAWAGLAPVAGFLLARKFKTTSGIFSKGSLLAGALRSAWRLWENFRARRSDPDRTS
jgi:hypothetical protein